MKRGPLTLTLSPLRGARANSCRESGMAAWRAVAVGALAVVAAACSEVRGPSIDRLVAPLVWGGEQKLLASDAAELDQFGCSVSLANDGAADRAVVGAFGESDGR